MTTLKCTQCQRVFTKPTKVQAEAALRMHTGRKHTGSIPTANRKHEVNRNGNGNGSLAVAVPTDRRTRAWREANPHLALRTGRRKVVETNGAPESACFCPRCGLNLGVLNTAMQVAAHMSPA